MDEEVRGELDREVFERERKERETRDAEKTRRNREKREKMKARKGKGKTSGGDIKDQSVGDTEGDVLKWPRVEAIASEAGARDEVDTNGEVAEGTQEVGLIIHDDD